MNRHADYLTADTLRHVFALTHTSSDREILRSALVLAGNPLFKRPLLDVPTDARLTGDARRMLSSSLGRWKDLGAVRTDGNWPREWLDGMPRPVLHTLLDEELLVSVALCEVGMASRGRQDIYIGLGGRNRERRHDVVPRDLPIVDLIGWLRVAVRVAFLDCLHPGYADAVERRRRQKSAKATVVTLAGSEESVAAPAPPPHVVAEQNELLEQITAKERAILTLVARGWSATDISRAAGQSDDWAAQITSRMRKRVRKASGFSPVLVEGGNQSLCVMRAADQQFETRNGREAA